MPVHDDTTEELDFLREEVRRLRQELNRLTPSLAMLLKRRGFRVYKKEPADDLLLPAAPFLDSYYEMLHRYSFRLFLRDVIKHQNYFILDQVARYATSGVTREYIDHLVSVKLLRKSGKGYALASGPVRSFGATLEWYIAELLRREFGAEALWGVKFRRPKVGGDYDVLAKLDGALLYLEVKSSPPKQIYDSEVRAFLDRVDDLAPEASIFLMDTELRMKDKLVPMFEAALAGRMDRPPAVVRLERELFEIGGRVFIVNAKESIKQNIERALGRYFRSRQT